MEQSELKRTWDAALGDIQLQMTRATFDTWMKGTELVNYQDGTYIISTPSPYAVEWLENRLRRMIKQTLERHVGQAVSLKFVVRAAGGEAPAPDEKIALSPIPPPEPATTAKTTPAPKSAGPIVPTAPAPAAAVPSATQPATIAWQAQERYSFDTFIVGPSNRLAHAAAVAVAERPALAYNPLFIYGGVGLGKTHLLLAVKHEVEHKGLTAVYVSSERFTNEFVADIRSQNTEAFRARYRSTDMLLIDDIQFLAGKEGTQEEFFHTFNSLHAAGKQIIISSDKPPKAIMLLEERLRSRFEGGLVCDIAPPDLETRMAILQAKAETQTIPVPAVVIELIAHRVQSNIRELEGALIRVVAHAQLNNQALTVELTEKVLRDVLDRPQGIALPLVLSTTANFYNITMDELESSSRRKPIAFARQVAMYLAREETDASLAEIGEMLGGRDHSTILYGVEKITDLIESNDGLRREVVAIRERLYNNP
ncbi:MAG: chromosomal replication initiator protein DnaA [Ardenticatenales bacterium]|nr:chromosomal replication initiator protein DnaA [Ardenticatenales bacterium]